MSNDLRNYSVTLGFEKVSLPPFQDILILGKKCPQGMKGVSKCLQLLEPDCYELLEVDDAEVEAILVNKDILAKIPIEKVLQILRDKVFPYIRKGEIIKVDFRVRVYYESFDVTME